MKMKKTKLIFSLLLLLLVFTQAIPVLAHPADVYTHHIYVNIAQGGVSIKWEIRPGPLLIQSIWFNADADQNGTVSDEEGLAWANDHLSKITSLLNGVKMPLTLDGVKFPSSVDLFQAGQEFIVINLSASPIDSDAAYQLIFRNGFEEQKSLNWYYITTTDGMKFETPQQKNAQIALKIFPPSTQDSAQVKLLDAWDSSMPSLSGWQGGTPPATPEPAAPTPEQNANLERLLNLVRAKEFSLSFYIFALGISLILGALHALTPGHGKTVVAAYLVGSRGTVWHAVVLGSVVTLTHTGSVFLLGIITLAASKYIVPTDIIPWLEILSGLLIVGLGLYLLWQRFVYWWKSRQPAPVEEKAARKISLTPSAAPKKVTGVTGIQKPSANMHHHGDGKLHSHDVPEAITWRSLIALGVSGGLVPCPDAIAILLVAVAINRIFLGLALIVSFSLGLAVVLIAIGLLMVSSRRLFDKVSFLDKVAPIMPIVSAVVVLALGFALTWGAYVRAKDSLGLGEAGAGGVEDARIVYQLEGQDRIKQLFISDIRGSQPEALTSGPNSAVDFAPSPDGSRIAYIAQTGDLKNEIWLVDVNSGENKKLTDCTEAMCSQPVWSPDGSRVLYEHISLEAANATGLATLWWVDVNTGTARSLFQEEQLPGANPRWSPDGKWLSYATSENIQLYNLESGETRTVASALGASAAWAPDGKSVLYRDVIIQSNQFITQLFIYDLETDAAVNISPDLGFENILAAWSPDGEWIAVVRRDLSIPRGDQIWVMRRDGSEARAVTDSPNSLHGTLSWSGDGQSILYDLYDLDAFPLASKLQMVEAATGKVTDLGIAGYNPKWLWP